MPPKVNMTLRGSDVEADALHQVMDGYGIRVANKAIWQAVRDAPGHWQRIDALTSEVAELRRALDDMVKTGRGVQEAERERDKALDRANVLLGEAAL